MENTRIEQSLRQYRQIGRLSEDIETTLQERNVDLLSSLYRTMSKLQEEVKADDSAILDLLRLRPDLHNSVHMHELLTLMQQIQERIQRLMPQINDIMAVHRNELQKLKKGNTLLQGYCTSPDQTGRRISSTN